MEWVILIILGLLFIAGSILKWNKANEFVWVHNAEASKLHLFLPILQAEGVEIKIEIAKDRFGNAIDYNYVAIYGKQKHRKKIINIFMYSKI